MGKLAEIFTRGGALLGTDHLFDETTPVFLALKWVVAFTEILDGKRSITRRVIAAPGDPVGEYGKTIIGVDMPFAKTPVLAEVVRTGRPAFLDNLPTLQPGPEREATALGASMERAQVIRSAWCPIITNGKLSHLLAVTGRDLTEHDFVAVQLFAAQIGAAIHMRALRNALVHKERLAAVGQMAAVMAHEVRNPLGTIFNAVASLRRADKGSANLPDLLDILQEEADRLQRLVADLLDFSRPSVVEVAPIDLRPVLEHAIDSARLDPALGGEAKEVQLQIADKLPVIDTDARLLHRALVNLLVNALQNVDADGKVSLRAFVERDTLSIVVHNDGDVVAPDLAERLFEPFFTTRATGTGLGLAVVRRIAEDLGGNVRLAPGGGTRASRDGTTFTLSLPLSPSSVPRVRPA
jgi:signal transduction histidine kinase